MTVETLRRRALEVAGVVMVGHPDDGARRAIENYGRVDVLGVLPLFGEVTADALLAWSPTLDPEGSLVARLR
jgi:hypothetical protein